MNRTPPPTAEPADHWHRNWFDQDYLALYRHRDHREADRFLDRLAVHHGFRPATGEGEPVLVLDLGCGSGRHSLELARRGYHCVGLDWSPELLAVAHGQDDEGRFLRGDMARPPLRPVFHWVLNLFTSFGYRQEDGHNEAILARMAALVRPGGRLLIDYLNPAFVERHLVAHSRRELDALVVQEHRRIDTGTNQVVKQIVLTRPDGSLRQAREAVKLYPPAWFTERLAPAGFRLQAHLGDYEGGPFGEGPEPSPRSILLLEHTAEGTLG
jgi:SAM-dependent methyltransferase